MTIAQERNDFIARLVSMKAEAMRSGLVRTAQALEEPQTVVGYELADILEGRQVNLDLRSGG